jgi:hypothetical protein
VKVLNFSRFGHYRVMLYVTMAGFGALITGALLTAAIKAPVLLRKRKPKPVEN